MLSAITISLVSEAQGGPFIFWDDLEAAIQKASALGFDAVEIFPPGPDAIPATAIRPLLNRYNLKLAAVGTGAGWVKHKLRLTAPDGDERKKAFAFVRSIIDAAGALEAPAIIGSMQGRWGDGVEKETALGYLADAIHDLGNHAKQYGVPLIYEPLNRYETNLVNAVSCGVKLIEASHATNVTLLADLFHMNIEEADLAASIRAGGKHIGHVHLADSNRRPAGMGHTNFAPIAAALREIRYKGYISAEAFSYPNAEAAAEATIQAFKLDFA